jgi:hypothetical protein
MKRLTITVLVAGLFASENTIMGMDKEKCMAMHKTMHQDMNKNDSSKELSTFEKHQNILNPEKTLFDREI